MRSTVTFRAILMVSVGGSVKYEHISDSNYDDRKLEFVCGEKKTITTYHSGYTASYYRIITFSNCRFHEMECDFLKVFDHLQTFDISGVELEKLEIKTLREAKTLNTLLASDNHLTEISSHLFINAAHIDYVDFSNNFIQRIDPTAFEGANQLKTLNLSYNHMDKLQAGWISLASLLTLDLSHNNLTQFTEHAFDAVINLKKLSLSHNSIGRIEIGTFAYLMGIWSICR